MKFWRPEARRAPDRRQAAAIAVGVVALVAAVMSFRHQAGVAAGHGESAWSSKLFPLSVDGLIAAGTIALVSKDQALRWARIAVGLGIAMSVWANIGLSGVSPFAAEVAVKGWPPVALVVAVEVLGSMARERKPTENKATPEPASQPAPAQEPVSQPRMPVPAKPEPAPEPKPAPAEPVPEPIAAPSNKAAPRRGQALLPPPAVAGLLDTPPADVMAAILAGASADELVSQFPDVKPYRAKQLVKRHRASSNGHNAEEAG